MPDLDALVNALEPHVAVRVVQAAGQHGRPAFGADSDVEGGAQEEDGKPESCLGHCGVVGGRRISFCEQKEAKNFDYLQAWALATPNPAV
jgi:hypothetical protein